MGYLSNLKGIEKLDSQWFSVPKPLPGSKQRRGEYLFLDCSAPSLVSKVIIASGQTKTCKLSHVLEHQWRLIMHLSCNATFLDCLKRKYCSYALPPFSPLLYDVLV